MNLNKRYPITLICEVGPDIHAPSTEELQAAVCRMHPKGPSFLSLNCEGLGYMQAGGGDGRFSVECREWGEPYVHLVAGKGTPSQEIELVEMSGGYTKVFMHEVLSLKDVIELMSEYLLNFRPSSGFLWRDVTKMFIQH